MFILYLQKMTSYSCQTSSDSCSINRQLYCMQ